jgi:hypothetical protein
MNNKWITLETREGSIYVNTDQITFMEWLQDEDEWELKVHTSGNEALTLAAFLGGELIETMGIDEGEYPWLPDIEPEYEDE